MKKALPYILIAGILVVGYLLIGGGGKPADNGEALIVGDESVSVDNKTDVNSENSAAAEGGEAPIEEPAEEPATAE